MESPNQQNYIGQLMNTYFNQLQEAKQTIVFDRINELNLHYDQEEEMQRRFKSVTVETHANGYECWYYNDGSLNGQHLVTFILNDPRKADIFKDAESYKLDMGFTYTFEDLFSTAAPPANGLRKVD